MKTLSLVAVPVVALLLGQSAFAQSVSYTEAAATGDFNSAPGPSQTGGSQNAGALVWYTSRAAFQAAVPNLCNNEDFQLDTTPFVTNHTEPLWVCTNDADTQPGEIDGSLTIKSSGGGGVVTLAPGVIGTPTIVAGANTFLDSTILGFCNEPTGVGFDIFSNGAPPDPVDIRVYDCLNNLMGTMTYPATAGTPTFVGVESPAPMPPIWRIEVDSTSGSGELVDDLEWDGHCNPTLAADNKYVQSGQSLTLAISETAPNSRGLLYVTAVNGVPFLVKVAGPLPVFPVWCSAAIPVPAAPTVNVGLTAFIIDPVNGVTITNTKTIYIN